MLREDVTWIHNVSLPSALIQVLGNHFDCEKWWRSHSSCYFRREKNFYPTCWCEEKRFWEFIWLRSVSYGNAYTNAQSDSEVKFLHDSTSIIFAYSNARANPLTLRLLTFPLDLDLATLSSPSNAASLVIVDENKFFNLFIIRGSESEKTNGLGRLKTHRFCAQFPNRSLSFEQHFLSTSSVFRCFSCFFGSEAVKWLFSGKLARELDPSKNFAMAWPRSLNSSFPRLKAQPKGTLKLFIKTNGWQWLTRSHRS